ncbi:MAG: hypothetical protein L0Z62_40500 [Gemmataceae bacterium]|nr:hypothetical protein [Gemmataceae bacterium]
MSAPVPIPVTVDPEAAERVAELGMQAELEHMLEQARQLIPGLWRLQVAFGTPSDTGSDLPVIIEAYRDPAGRQPDDQTWHRYNQWQMTTFSLDVCRHFRLLIRDETYNGPEVLSSAAIARQGDAGRARTPPLPSRSKLLDKSVLKQKVAALEQRLGFAHDPTATAEQAQAMMRARGILPEDRLLSSEILHRRREHEEAP